MAVSLIELREVDPGAFVVAYLRGEAVGCRAVKHQPHAVTDIKRMWVAESARGLGLGRRLLEHLEGLARERGSREAHLETSDVLPEAIALYRSAGYAEVPRFNDEPFADRWYAKPLLDARDGVSAAGAAGSVRGRAPGRPPRRAG